MTLALVCVLVMTWVASMKTYFDKRGIGKLLLQVHQPAMQIAQAPVNATNDNQASNQPGISSTNTKAANGDHGNWK